MLGLTIRVLFYSTIYREAVDSTLRIIIFLLLLNTVFLCYDVGTFKAH